MSKAWKKAFTESLVATDEIVTKLQIDPQILAAVTDKYPFRLTRHYFSLIKKENDPIWRQAIPHIAELHDNVQKPDPLNESALSPVSGLIHRYPDRVVWLVSNECPVYCRFCMRKRQVGCTGEPLGNLTDVIRYIADNPSIRDVILSGGDPLLLDDDQLEEILSSLKNIPHVEIVRIGTRVPVTFPERVTSKLALLLKRYHPIYINTHFNHPSEINPDSHKACAMLADVGISLGNQTVLLKGVNDSPETIQQLFRGLLSIRVRPYYLHQMDLVQGTAHFRTSIKCGLDIMQTLRGHMSGLAVPYYVIDLPGGKGKVPLLPGHKINEDGSIQITTYLGEELAYGT